MNYFGSSHYILNNIYNILLLYFWKHFHHSLKVFFGKLSKWLTLERKTEWENRASCPTLGWGIRFYL